MPLSRGARLQQLGAMKHQKQPPAKNPVADLVGAPKGDPKPHYSTTQSKNPVVDQVGAPQVDPIKPHYPTTQSQNPVVDQVGAPQVDLNKPNNTTTKDCHYCLKATMHICMKCSLIRCKQFHLDTRDDGDTFICQDCDPTIQGIMGQRGETAPGKMPGAVQSGICHAVQAPSPKRPRLDIPQAAHVLQWLENLPPTEDQISIHNLTLPPTEDQISIHNPTSSPVRRNLFGSLLPHPSVPVVQHPPLVPPPPVPLVHSEVEFHKGNVKDVIFCGATGCTHWPHTDLKTTYWVAPLLGQVVMLRSRADCLVQDAYKHIRAYMVQKSDHIMLEPILTYRGSKEFGKERLSEFQNGDTLLIHDQEVPTNLKKHCGQLWKCSKCVKVATTWSNLSRTKCKPSGKAHKVLFKEILDKVSTWGRNLDQHKLPYGCPLRHTGTGAESLKQVNQPPQPHPQQNQTEISR